MAEVPWWLVALGLATGVVTAVVVVLLMNRPR
jgi:hypothetical protein